MSLCVGACCMDGNSTSLPFIIDNREFNSIVPYNYCLKHVPTISMAEGWSLAHSPGVTELYYMSTLTSGK